MGLEYVKSVIKGREVTYYLTSEEDLNNLKQKGILSDFFAFLFSVSVGGVISITISKTIAISTLSKEINNLLNLLNIVFIISTIIFFILTIIFLFLSYGTISKIKGSGKLKSISSKGPIDEEEFEIIEAKYWTPKYIKISLIN